MKSIAALLTAVFFWALNFYLGKIMMETVSPNAAAFWRYFFGVLTLFILSASTLPSWEQIKKHIIGLSLVGFCLFGFIWSFFMGLKFTSEMNAALIVSLNPATTLVLAIFFQGHKVSTREIIGIILAFIGVLYLLSQGQLATLFQIQFNKGDLLFLLANLLFALQNIWIKKYAPGIGHLNFTTLTSLCCLLGFLFLLCIEKDFPPLSQPIAYWVAAVISGVFGTALAYFCWNYGVTKIGPARGAVFINALPLFTALFAIAFGAELFDFHLISSALIIAGLLFVQIKQ